jgi:GT2 family glycosyltransferase
MTIPPTTDCDSTQSGGEVVVVAATRASREKFWQSMPLGLSLARLGPTVKVFVRYENSRGLPEIYNEAIAGAPAGSRLVFAHDDVFLDDYWLCTRLDEALRVFDLVGVAGNRFAPEGHVGWAFAGFGPDGRPAWDRAEHLSGRVCHRVNGLDRMSDYGPIPRACSLLDGVLLAARTDVLQRTGVRFDPRFAFHFYDLDFCRSFAAAGRRIGTWPLAVTHYSAGAFGSPEWHRALSIYREKWNPRPPRAKSASQTELCPA